MRLYLSSYQLGDEPERLVSLVGSGRRGVVILNAFDAGDPERRSADVARQIAQLASLGLDAVELDLRRHTPATIADAFADIGFCWVRGGNVFVLREALAHSGADRVIIDALRRRSSADLRRFNAAFAPAGLRLRNRRRVAARDLRR